jgi:hypothetical protein
LFGHFYVKDKEYKSCIIDAILHPISQTTFVVRVAALEMVVGRDRLGLSVTMVIILVLIMVA